MREPAAVSDRSQSGRFDSKSSSTASRCMTVTSDLGSFLFAERLAVALKHAMDPGRIPNTTLRALQGAAASVNTTSPEAEQSEAFLDGHDTVRATLVGGLRFDLHRTDDEHHIRRLCVAVPDGHELVSRLAFFPICDRRSPLPSSPRTSSTRREGYRHHVHHHPTLCDISPSSSDQVPCQHVPGRSYVLASVSSIRAVSVASEDVVSDWVISSFDNCFQFSSRVQWPMNRITLACWKSLARWRLRYSLSPWLPVTPINLSVF